jgi:transcription elongation GreA/GreB family factor
MAGARWEELDRAIRAKDGEAAERAWLELIEQDSGDAGKVDAFLKAAEGIMEKAGGRRQAGVLLWMLAGALKDKGSDRDLVRVYVRLARTAPDDGTLRTAIVEAVRKGWAGRADVEALLERSGVVGGPPTELAKQSEALERYLRLEPGAYVFHKTGWGIGRIAEYHAERGRCVIHFRTKPGHEMDILAAADLLERLPEEDLRVMAAYKQDELRFLAKAKPLDVLRKALARLGGDAPLRHVKDVLVPDAVEKTEWAGWWREAKKAATLDPGVKVGTGSDPRLTLVQGASEDFSSTLTRRLAFASGADGKRAVVKEFARTAGNDAGARKILADAARTELAGTSERDSASRLSWALVLADLEGHDPKTALAPVFAEAADPKAMLRSIADEDLRASAARGCIRGRPADGPDVVLTLALDQDVVAAEALAEHALASSRRDLLDRLLDPVFSDPTTRPLLYAWAVRGLGRNRWPGRPADPARLAEQVLRVLDAVAYRARRHEAPTDRKAVDSLADLLADRNCKIAADAAAACDVDTARHLLRLVTRNPGLKPRLVEKISDTILRAHPTALRQEGAAAAGPTPSTTQEIYMTAAGIEKLRRDHDRIVNEEMPANQAEIARAREFGDLSENAEYHAAREKQALLLAKSNDLKNQIAMAREIRPEIVRTDAVTVGTRVRLRDAEGREVSYALLGPADADVSRHVINYQTPLGQSLMGRKPGDTVTLEMGEDRHVYHVLGIESALGAPEGALPDRR